MKFALFEFVSADCGNEGNGLHVGESCWIVDLDEQWANNTHFDFDEEVQVIWPASGDQKKGAQTYTAKVHRFSDEKKELNELLESLLQEECDVSSRGRKRKLKKVDSDSEELGQEKEPVKGVGKKRQQSKSISQKESLKRSQQALMSKLETQLEEYEHPTSQTVAIEPLVTKNWETTVKGHTMLEEQNLKLRKENSWLKNQVLTSLKVFPALVDKLTCAVSDSASSCQSGTTPEFGSRSPSCGLSSTSTPQTPCSVKESPKLDGLIAEDIVTREAASCISTDPRKMTNNWLIVVFGLEHLGTHSLTGTTTKPALNSQKVASIINAVMKNFQHETERNIQHYITDYLNNASRSSRSAGAMPTKSSTA